MSPIISVKNLKKYYDVFEKETGLLGAVKSVFKRRYRKVKAVDGISFSIKEGEIIGFIGPNGAGKTTTLKVLSGLLYPTEGNISVAGFNPWERKTEFLKKIALVMGQKNQLWWDLPPLETFQLNKEIYEITDKEFKETLEELSKILQVENLLQIPTRKLSLGERMKMELIASLLHKPKILFLDEPTIGLDVVAQKSARDFIRQYNQKYNSTIILTSHYMADVQQLAKRVIVIDQGKILFDGRLEKLTAKFAKNKFIDIVFSQAANEEDLKNLGEVQSFTPPRATILVQRKNVPVVTSQLLDKFKVQDLEIKEMPIEEVIRQVFTNGKIK